MNVIFLEKFFFGGKIMMFFFPKKVLSQWLYGALIIQ
jgi:hypothetical protein